MKQSRWKTGLLLIVAVCSLAVVVASSEQIDKTHPIDSERYQDLMFDQVDDIYDLEEYVWNERVFYQVITPPDKDFVLRQPCGEVIPFRWKSFPPAFLKALAPQYENSVPLYPVAILEDPMSRETVFADPKGKRLFTLPPAPGYDPYTYLKKLFPNLYSGLYSSELIHELQELYDPSRVQILVKLVALENVEPYLYAAAQIEQARRSAVPLKPGGLRLRSPAADTHIVFESITKAGNGLLYKIGYPSSLTNALTIYGSVNLQAFQWFHVATNLSTFGTNEISFLYTNAFGSSVASNLQLAVGNGDLESDGDGLKDADEFFLHRSQWNSVDSDGDGLVDGYSGVVSSNAYSGGISTNGVTIIGELSLGTTPYLADSDGDAMHDGAEIVNHTDPLNPNDPPSVSGTITYSGRQTGSFWVVAVTESGFWSTNGGVRLASPGAYQIPNLIQTSYYVKALCDTDGNGLANATEAYGALTGSPVTITNKMTGTSITLTDPDNDADTLPDWWEVLYFGNTAAMGATNDPDSDTYSNQEEYGADTHPANITSHPANIEGSVSYSGPQTGLVHVIATTSSVSWSAFGSAVLTSPGAYAITHLPTNRFYTVKAFRDNNGNGSNDYSEAVGEYDDNPVLLVTNTTGIDIVLTNPDTDGDTLPDYWELQYGLDPFFGGEDGANLAWWKLDGNGSSTSVPDSTASANHGTLMGTTGNWTYGVMSNALAFDGLDDYVEVSDSATLKPNSISLAFWIRPDRTYAAGTNAVFISKREGLYGYSVSYENGALRFFIGDSGSHTATYACILSSGVWHHVVATYDNCRQDIYLNGVLQVTTNWNCGMSFGEIDHTTNALRMGASSTASPAIFYRGRMDDVRIINGAIYSNWVQGLYEQGTDADGDSLSYWEEYHRQSDPLDWDTDEDGLSDGAEVYQYHTNPANEDTDQDGTSDSWEIQRGLNPLQEDSMQDSDSDGCVNLEEYVRGTNPFGSDPPPPANGVVTLRYYYDQNDRLNYSFEGKQSSTEYQYSEGDNIRSSRILRGEP